MNQSFVHKLLKVSISIFLQPPSNIIGEIGFSLIIVAVGALITVLISIPNLPDWQRLSVLPSIWFVGLVLVYASRKSWCQRKSINKR